MHKSHLKPAHLTRLAPSEADTLAFGAALGRVLEPPLVVYVSGELGAGKTTFVRGVLRGLGYAGRVKSPTFSLVEVYEFSKLYFYHFDFYRFDAPQDLIETGLREYFAPDAVCMAEWPEKAAGLPPADIRIAIRVTDGGRVFEVDAEREAGIRCLERLA